MVSTTRNHLKLPAVSIDLIALSSTATVPMVFSFEKLSRATDVRLQKTKVFRNVGDGCPKEQFSPAPISENYILKPAFRKASM